MIHLPWLICLLILRLEALACTYFFAVELKWKIVHNLFITAYLHVSFLTKTSSERSFGVDALHVSVHDRKWWRNIMTGAEVERVIL